jgi:mRNA interferase MazF
LQSDELPLSTVIIAPTSRSARPRSYRPSITVGADTTQVMIEQTMAVAPERLGEYVGHLRLAEMSRVDDALRLTLALD